MTVQPPAASPVAKMELGVYVSKAWDLMKANALLLIVTYLIAAILAGIPLVGLIIGGPLMFGFVRIIQKRYKGEPAEIGQVFDGFKDFSKGLVTMLLMVAVILCVLIPVVIAFVVLSFVPVCGALLGFLLYICALFAIWSGLYFVMEIAALSDVTPVDSIKKGLAFLMAHLGEMVLLAIVTMLISMAGFIACGIGILFTAPMAFTICVIAYNEFYLPNAPAA